eukprot:s1545_g3.t1
MPLPDVFVRLQNAAAGTPGQVVGQEICQCLRFQLIHENLGMRLGDDTTPPECPGLDGHEYLPLAGDLAKDLLLQAGVDAGEKEKLKSAKKDDKKVKKEKKDSKTEKKKKRGLVSTLRFLFSKAHLLGFFSEIQAMFCLRQKDLVRQNGQDRLDDLSTRQIAFVISGAGAGSYLAAADLQEIGGELEPRLQKCFLSRVQYMPSFPILQEEAMQAPKKKASKASVKEEQEEESDGEKPEDDDEDCDKSLGDGWPSASGGDDDEDDADDDDDDRNNEKGQAGEKEQEDGDSSDDDLFAGKFVRQKQGQAQPGRGSETLFEKLSIQIQKQAQGIEQSVLKSLPQDIPL